MNRTTAIFVAVAAAVLVASLGGCDFGDLVRVDTPRNIQSTEGLPSRLTLNDAREEYEDWIAAARNDSMRWRTGIERSQEITNLLEQFTLQQLNDVGPAIAGVPVLGPALPLITGLAGLLVTGPGQTTRKKAEAEKKAESEKAWDEAKDEAFKEYARARAIGGVP